MGCFSEEQVRAEGTGGKVPEVWNLQVFEAGTSIKQELTLMKKEALKLLSESLVFSVRYNLKNLLSIAAVQDRKLKTSLCLLLLWTTIMFKQYNLTRERQTTSLSLRNVYIYKEKDTEEEWDKFNSVDLYSNFHNSYFFKAAMHICKFLINPRCASKRRVWKGKVYKNTYKYNTYTCLSILSD